MTGFQHLYKYYQHKLKATLEKIHWEFDIQTAHLIQKKKKNSDDSNAKKSRFAWLYTWLFQQNRMKMKKLKNSPTFPGTEKTIKSRLDEF